ncbi:MAG: TrbI/VirB10 family protein [Planctomycetes bacterium]|nr:TrbI/VirB10 family protein [Planctomycetota bacterium]
MDDRAYVCVLSYPDDLSERERIVVLSEALAIDEYTASVAAKWSPPAIVKVCPIEPARTCVHTLEELGIRAYAAQQKHIDRLSEPIVAKRLRPAIDAPEPMYAYEPLRPRLHEPGGFAMSAVFAMIAGRVRERRSVTATRIPGDTPGPATGAADDEGRAGMSGNVVSSSATERLVLDLYLKDSRCIRIDSGQFSFDFLEGKLGLTDRENFARACERMRAEAPGAVFDEGFESFRPPPSKQTMNSRTFGDGSVTIRNEGPAFDFYSAWKCLLYVHERKRAR